MRIRLCRELAQVLESNRVKIAKGTFQKKLTFSCSHVSLHPLAVVVEVPFYSLVAVSGELLDCVSDGSTAGELASKESFE